MADQLNNGENAVPLYEVVDRKTTSVSKDYNNDYSMLNMSTLNKDGIYAGISTGEPATSRKARKPLKVTNYTRMVCISAGVAILVICFITICATLFVEMANLKSKL
jgi:hypothetical protein